MMNTIYYTKGYKYQLTKNHKHRLKNNSLIPTSNLETGFISLDTSGLLTVKAGYAWDGPSGPTVDTNSAMRASLLHDVGYQLLRAELLPQKTRESWDLLYEYCCLEDGMNTIRAYLHFKALRLFGKRSALPTSERKTLTAP